jgi:YqaJ-like viral recombinase domain
MAQAESVPSSSRQLITGETVNQSTNLPAVLPAVRMKPAGRGHFIGGSDARIIMGADEAALIRLWREKRGEIEPEDLSGNLIVQLGVATEDLNRRWYEANTGQVSADIQKRFYHPALQWMAATVDGRIEGTDAVFEAKFMLPWVVSPQGQRRVHGPGLPRPSSRPPWLRR